MFQHCLHSGDGAALASAERHRFVANSFPNRGRVRAYARPGITLIDLVLTTLILGLVAAAATPRFSGVLAHYRAGTAAQRIAADLNYARNQARQTSTTASVTFSAVPPAYRFTGVRHLDHAGDYEVALDDFGYDVTLTSVDFDGGMTLKFNEHGLPFAGAPVQPLQSGSILISSGSLQHTVVIDQQTGRASVQ